MRKVFRSMLQAERLLAHEVLIIMGDYNAKVVPDNDVRENNVFSGMWDAVGEKCCLIVVA